MHTHGYRLWRHNRPTMGDLRCFRERLFQKNAALATDRRAQRDQTLVFRIQESATMVPSLCRTIYGTLMWL